MVISFDVTGSKHNTLNDVPLFSADNGSMSTISSGPQNQQPFEVSNPFFIQTLSLSSNLPLFCTALPLCYAHYCVTESAFLKTASSDVCANMLSCMMNFVLEFAL